MAKHNLCGAIENRNNLSKEKLDELNLRIEENKIWADKFFDGKQFQTNNSRRKLSQHPGGKGVSFLVGDQWWISYFEESRFREKVTNFYNSNFKKSAKA